MPILLDTHIFLAFTKGTNSFIPPFIHALNEPSHDKYLSIVSLWEIAIKISIGKLKLNGNLDDLISLTQAFDIQILSIKNQHLKLYTELPLIHRDPFDRLIIAQALSENFHLVTDDKMIRTYPNITFFE